MAKDDGIKKRGRRIAASRGAYAEQVIMEARDLAARDDITLREACEILVQEGYDLDGDPILREWSQQWP